MKLNIKVTPIDGDPYVVQTNLFTIVAWERKFKRPASDMGSAMGAEWMAYLAYEACKQNNIPVPITFDDFLKKIESVSDGDSEPENPTDGVPTADS